jgi:methionine synthase I (cobalamin-dependent)
MKKFLIERQIPGVGNMSLADLRTVARKSVNVLAGLGVEIQWVESYISGDKIYCVYLATDEELIREHARLTGIPANTITEVFRNIDPTVASLADSAVQ